MPFSSIENDKLKIISWTSAREMVKKVNASLFSELEAADYHDSSPPLILCTYDYGDMITKNGELQIPAGPGNKLLPISHPDVPKPIKEMLGYSRIPLFLLLNKSSEVFVYNGTHPIPLNFFDPGSLLGLFETMDFMFHTKSRAIWWVSAGARSIFMLPKITETQSFMRLSKAYGLPMTLRPRTSFDHWELFVELAKKASDTLNSWKSQVILFPKHWVKMHDSKSFSPLQVFLIKDAWKNAHDVFGKIKTGLFWQNLVGTISSRNLKPKPALFEHVRHLMGMAQGQFPGFRPIEQNENAAPCKLIQNAFIETYKLENFPSILHAHPAHTVKNSPVYYSLSHPTLLEGVGFKKDSQTIISELREIALIMDTQKERFSASPYDEINPNMYSFEYFHTHGNVNDKIRPVEEIFKKDPAFLEENRSHKNLNLCTTSNFFNGCLRIKNCNNSHSE